MSLIFNESNLPFRVLSQKDDKKKYLLEIKKLLTTQGFVQVVEYAHRDPTAMAVVCLLNGLRGNDRSGKMLTLYRLAQLNLNTLVLRITFVVSEKLKKKFYVNISAERVT